jgi:hypothetical protein
MPYQFSLSFTPTRPPSVEGDENATIVPRLQGAVARVLPAIEATIARLAGGTHDARDVERAGRTLSALMRTLRELNALLAQHNARLDAAQDDDDPVPKDMDEFRYELARRIRGFIAARQISHGAQSGAHSGQEAGPAPQPGCLPTTAMDGPART